MKNSLDSIKRKSEVRDVSDLQQTPLRVVISDDSMVIRRIIRDALTVYPDIQVVGVARNGVEAVQAVSLLSPDVILLDVEMPVLNGVEALKDIRLKNPDVSLIMFSSMTSQGATTTLEALENGAHDYVSKPEGAVSIKASVEVINVELVKKIRYWGLASRIKKRSSLASQNSECKQESNCLSKDTQQRSFNGLQVDVIVIGISTGGPNALAEILGRLSPEMRIPIVIVQHMPSLFTALLAKRLDRLCHLDVIEAVEGEVISPGKVILAPGDRHLLLKRTTTSVVCHIEDSYHVNSCRPSVDLLFESAAKIYGQRITAIVMTGMGKDGTEGARAIKENGGTVVAQDAGSSVVYGMPKSVIEAGHASIVLSLDEIIQHVNSCAKNRLRNS